MIDTTDNKIENLLERGVVDVIQKDKLRKKLQSKKQLRIKLGIDPSGADLHIGHMVVIKKLKEFQDLGHQIILLFGNFTGQIGDPTGKMETRKAKTKEELDANAQKYLKQASFFLDVDNVEVRWNADWLAKLSFADVVQLASTFTVSQMMERDMFQERHDKNMPISVHEFFYPLMQGYDSVALEADVEIGGTDQTFNMLAGRTIQRAYNMTEQDILTVPILEGTDGIKKMGKSEDNYIAVDDDPNDMFGKVMSIPDDLIVKYFELTTNIPLDEIKQMEQAIKDGENPMFYKKKAAKEIIEIYHDEQAAEIAEKQFTKVFSEHKLPDEMPEISTSGNINLIDLMVQNNMAPSKSEARRLIKQGAVKYDNVKAEAEVLDINKGKHVLQVGKRRFLKIIVKG